MRIRRPEDEQRDEHKLTTALPGSADGVMALQRSAGNHAVAGLMRQVTADWSSMGARATGEAAQAIAAGEMDPAGVTGVSDVFLEGYQTMMGGNGAHGPEMVHSVAAIEQYLMTAPADDPLREKVEALARQGRFDDAATVANGGQTPEEVFGER